MGVVAGGINTALITGNKLTLPLVDEVGNVADVTSSPPWEYILTLF